MKKYLIIMQQNLYENSLALEALEFALAVSAFEQSVSLLFRGAGVLQLLSSKPDLNKIIGKDFTRVYSDLNLFGIDNVYIELGSLEEFAVDNLLLQPQIVNDRQIKDLCDQHDIIIPI